MSYFEDVSPTYLENWPSALHRLSIASADVPLDLKEARDLDLNIMEWGAGFVVPGETGALPTLEPLRQRVKDVVVRFPKGCFLRLGSRSPKDSWLGYKTGLKVTAEDADPLRFFLDCSERIHDDLQLALLNNYSPFIWAREWLDIPPWSEVRCFWRDGALVGMSQYLYRKVFPQLIQYKDTMEWAIRHFAERFFAPAIHLPRVVFDVFVRIKEHDEGRDRDVEVKLLEINPWGEFTDPCLYSWRGGGDFDGTFRTAT